jgi:hypothetical protein
LPAKREITLQEVEDALQYPDAVAISHTGRQMYDKLIAKSITLNWLRVIVDESELMLLTAYWLDEDRL